ncbi:MAG: DUF4974 domain-containing protein [Cytophagales bacterium]|nr:DUF4974 domain-containing protein [Cytophagales bacterium]
MRREAEQMIDEKILFLITNKLTGQISGEEEDLLNDWLSESNANKTLYHCYKEAFISGEYKLKAKRAGEVYKKLSDKLGIHTSKEFQDNKKTDGFYRHAFRKWYRVAAVFLILVTGAWIIYRAGNYWRPATEIAVSHELIVKSNPRGMKSLITLPDGSKVKLNAESHIEYYPDFEDDRTVKLIGEAFFEVVKDSLRPFEVKTGDLCIKVLGTSFNVEAFPYERDVKVALVTGKLMIDKQEDFEFRTLDYLVPDQMFTYNHQSSEFQVTSFSHDQVLGWKDGELNFKEAEFREVVERLERWYGVEIIVAPGADMSGRFSGVYKNASLDVVLEGMGFTSDFTYEIRGKKVYIK